MQNCRVITLTLLITLIVTSTLTAKNRALLVGIQNYKSYASLEACHGDVNDMKELLMRCHWEPDYIWDMKDDLGENMTASDLYSNVTAFSRGIQKGDRVIFFFSGHGIGDRSGENYLLGYDGNKDKPEKFTVKVSEIRVLLKEKNPAEVVMIIDACRNFVSKQGKGAGKKEPSRLNTGKGIMIQSSFKKQASQKSQGASRTIVKTIYSCAEGQQSFERKDKNNGAFTYYLTYLVDAPYSAMDIDMSKDGIISVEDLVLFTDNRLGDYCSSQGLDEMTPVYQTDGGIAYAPFSLMKYSAEQETLERKAKKVKPVFEYDEQAELAKIKKAQVDLSYMNEELPVYKPKDFSQDGIRVEELDSTNLDDWESLLKKEQEVERRKLEEEGRARKAAEKKKYYNKLKAWYNRSIRKVEQEASVYGKYSRLENMRKRVNSDRRFPDINRKILVLLEPIYQKLKSAKEKRDIEIADREKDFIKDLLSMEKMKESSLSREAKQKYLEAFKKKWQQYVIHIRNNGLVKRFEYLISSKDYQNRKFTTISHAGLIKNKAESFEDIVMGISHLDAFEQIKILKNISDTEEIFSNQIATYTNKIKERYNDNSKLKIEFCYVKFPFKILTSLGSLVEDIRMTTRNYYYLDRVKVEKRKMKIYAGFHEVVRIKKILRDDFKYYYYRGEKWKIFLPKNKSYKVNSESKYVYETLSLSNNECKKIMNIK